VRNAPNKRMTSETSATAGSSPQKRCITPQSTATPTRPVTSSSPCEQIVEFTDHSATRHRIRYVPQSIDRWQRIEEIWTGQEWAHVSQETVSDVNQCLRPIQP
jgi:hypothetical protein